VHNSAMWPSFSISKRWRRAEICCVGRTGGIGHEGDVLIYGNILRVCVEKTEIKNENVFAESVADAHHTCASKLGKHGTYFSTSTPTIICYNRCVCVCVCVCYNVCVF
jgi:hypothetical protein